MGYAVGKVKDVGQGMVSIQTKVPARFTLAAASASHLSVATNPYGPR